MSTETPTAIYHNIEPPEPVLPPENRWREYTIDEIKLMVDLNEYAEALQWGVLQKIDDQLKLAMRQRNEIATKLLTNRERESHLVLTEIQGETKEMWYALMEKMGDPDDDTWFWNRR